MEFMEKSSSLLVVTALLLGGCTDSIFGCPDRLIDSTPSPDHAFKAVARECGCKAQNGTYLVAAIVEQQAAGSCSVLEKVAVAAVTTKAGGKNDATGKVTVLWRDPDTLVVRLDRQQQYELRNDPILAHGAPPTQQPPAHSGRPRIVVVNDL
ncbi:hypothetical protein [Agrilutibacter solisilvae]|uniref:Lipoprotein n=1 Tax=Agrilutibacter solisilvae TaxID=2763317 RepID=A0A974Y1F8_9GAMM|nr:hypothetical protein [Lysobacter solisilvae]QSX79574.1 hypothetical protein I8J32_006910 [Lysobacter solisilvae]